MYQQKLFKGFYGILAYTFVRSQFEDADGDLIPSAWDNQHIVSITGGKKFGKNWEIGMRWLFTGGSPFTPYNVNATTLRSNWDVTPVPVFDYSRLNSQRGKAFHQLDMRIDRKFFFNKWTLNTYFDVQNAYNFESELQDYIDVQRNDSGDPIIDPQNPNNYLPEFIPNLSGTVLPTVGIILEF